MKDLEQAKAAYEAALAQRISRLNTRHTFEEAKLAANSLFQQLQEHAWVDLSSVGIGLKPDRSDVTLEVVVANAGSARFVPERIDGIEVQVQVSGPAVSY